METPVPSRFLTSKRPGTQQFQGRTPSQHTSGPHQFHATPRFAASTPRPSSTQARAGFTTPGLAIKPRVPRSRSTQDIINDSSPVSPDEGSPSGSPNTRNTLPEPIELDSSLVPQPPSPEGLERGRSPKRRRISIASSESETDSALDSQESEPADLDSLSDAPNHNIGSYHSGTDDEGNCRDRDASISPSQSAASSPRRPQSPDIKSECESGSKASDSEEACSEDNQATPKPTRGKPAFRAAPRFKLTEPPDRLYSHPDVYLTDPFSPQRRGSRYLPGGLAAELRDWLVDVKGGVDGEGEMKTNSAALSFTSATAKARVVVDEASSGGPGITLISGRLVDGVAGGGQDAEVRVILAGAGNIEGLGVGRGGGNRGRVAPGMVVSIAPPVWDVKLGVRWAVTYRWEVVKGVGGDIG
ncbi:hypothetical protein C8A03DRAFT_16037 [Achaetomium macrosporum]|uniref:Uncharacterized protein n=1 Tax=Achaetomium macrosporum TaxID=79813 RepID=A0AAN7C8K3_9PEZI|nr:hypothetical protein C8A03DRAFT_16037 [Achaetomium macrosporum]